MYVHLRGILDIIVSPRISESIVKVFECLVTRLNSLFMQIFGNFKPKFHLLLHYAQLFSEFGPAVFVWCIRYESKHRQLKAVAVTTSCSKNLLKTIAIKKVLKMCAMVDEIANLKDISLGSVDCKVRRVDNDLKYFNYVNIRGTMYAKETIVVVDNIGVEKHFGKILKVSMHKTELYFHLQLYEEIYFDDHIHAYAIKKLKKIVRIKYVDLLNIFPCSVMRKKITSKKFKLYLISRYVL